MRKSMFLLTPVIVAAIFLMAVPTYGAKSPLRRTSYFEGIFDMPSRIAEETDTSQLEAFLDDPDVLSRMSAVRRLGQLEGSKAAPMLARRFEKEPYGGTVTSRIYVKLEIIRTLGRMEGPEAKAALLNIAQVYLKDGPQVQLEGMEYPMGYLDRDYSNVLRNTFGALYQWRDDPNVLAVAQQGISLEHLNRSDVVGVAAWELYLAAMMAKEGKVTQQQCVDYLVNFLIENDLPTQKSYIDPVRGGRTLESMQTEAIANLVKRYDQAALDRLEAQVEPSPPFADTVRGRAVLFARNRIRDAIKAKAEAEASDSAEEN